MKIDGRTGKYVSISEKPGTFGLNFHNEGYEFLGINAIYIPLRVLPEDLESTLSLVRKNFKGCSVSMPHKEAVIPYLDEIVRSAEEIRAVNTIFNNNRRLVGFNTDYYGAREVIEQSLDIKDKKVLLIGAGGVARAISLAVKNLRGILTITNRTDKKAKDLADKLEAEVIPWNEREDFSGYLLINATSVGFINREEIPVSSKSIEKYEAVMDVVVGNTKLIKKAESSGKEVITGESMTVYQAAKQFEIYTGQRLPKSFLQKFLPEN